MIFANQSNFTTSCAFTFVLQKKKIDLLTNTFFFRNQSKTVSRLKEQEREGERRQLRLSAAATIVANRGVAPCPRQQVLTFMSVLEQGATEKLQTQGNATLCWSALEVPEDSTCSITDNGSDNCSDQ